MSHPSSKGSDEEWHYTKDDIVNFLSVLFSSAENAGLSTLDILTLVARTPACRESSLSTLLLHPTLNKLIFNFKDRLSYIAKHERQSGLYHALLGSMLGRGISATDLSSVLGVDIRTAKKTIAITEARQHAFLRTGHLPSILHKPKIKRLRIPAAVSQRIKHFFHAHTIPTADMKNVKRRRIARGDYEEKQVHYRTDTLQTLLTLYKVNKHSFILFPLLVFVFSNCSFFFLITFIQYHIPACSNNHAKSFVPAFVVYNKHSRLCLFFPFYPYVLFLFLYFTLYFFFFPVWSSANVSLVFKCRFVHQRMFRWCSFLFHFFT